MPNLTKAQRAAKDAEAAAAASASAPISSAEKTNTDQNSNGESGVAGDTAAAQNGADLEVLNVTSASEAAQPATDDAALDAASEAPVLAAPPAPAATIADQGSPSIGFPLRARITNKTRMPVQVPALHLDLPASGEATITLYSEGDFKTLHSDLTALFSLNGFGDDAFTVVPAETTEA